jgi:tuftelin-interacting protein 11
MAHRMHAYAANSSSDDSGSEDDFLHPSTDPRNHEFADYNPRKRRRTGRDAKESAALGIFGSESEDDGPGRRWKSKNIRSKGMSFVKPGERVGDDMDDEDNEDEPADNAAANGSATRDNGQDTQMEGDDEEEEDARPRLGLGASRPSGPGFFSATHDLRSPTSKPSPAFRRLGVTSANASPLGRGFVPSSEAAPILKDFDDEKPAPRKAMPSAFSTPTGTKHAKSHGMAKGSPVIANSFAARMMAKMGYKEGQGLGKDNQGRSGVIEVTLRPMGVGLGAVKEKTPQEREEERRQAALRGEAVVDSDEEEKKKRRRKAKASGTGTDSDPSTPKRRPKTKYQSLPEMQRAAPGLHIPDAFQPILDMTGPGQKLLTSTSGLLTPTAGTESNEIVEANKLARRAQNDLSSFVDEWKNLEERKAWAEMEIVQQQQQIDEQKAAMSKLDAVAGLVQGLADSVKDRQWDPVISALEKVAEIGSSGHDELANIAVAAVHPFFREAVEGWHPLEDPKLKSIAYSGFAPALQGIRDLLGMSAGQQNGNALAPTDQLLQNGSAYGRPRKTNPYESMMYTVWFPKVRSAVTNEWDVHDPFPLQSFLEAWEGLIPPFIEMQIYEKLIVPKLDEAVATWNPKKRRSAPPHLWLFPWLQYLATHHSDPQSSTGLVSDVKRKFRHLIDGWDFSRGVIPGLQKWQAVLRPHGQNDQWKPLVRNYVLPNLASYLRNNFQVAPQDQEPYMAYLNNTLQWNDILESRDMGQLLVDVMFPMWHEVLHQWLTLDEPNYLEIRDWFDFWRSIIPDELNAEPAVKAEWKKGNDMINLALDLGPDAKTRLPAPASAPAQSTRDSNPKESSSRHKAPPASAPDFSTEQSGTGIGATETSFRTQVEDWCMANDLQFIPEKNTLEAGGPVYRVTAALGGKGGVLIYLRGDSIFAQIKRGEWTPLGKEMDALLALAYR